MLFNVKWNLTESRYNYFKEFSFLKKPKWVFNKNVKLWKSNLILTIQHWGLWEKTHKHFYLSLPHRKLELTKYDFSQSFIFSKQNKHTKTRFIQILIKFTEDMFLKLLSIDTHFHIFDMRKVCSSKQSRQLGGHKLISNILIFKSDLNAHLM